MDSRERLSLRIQEATENDVLFGLFFNGAYAHLEAQLGNEAAAELRKRVIGDQSIVAFFRYPVVHLLELVRRALEQLGLPPGEDDAFLCRLGRTIVAENLNSTIAKTVANLGGGDVQKLFLVTPTATMTVISFGDRKAEKAGERSVTLTHKRDLLGPAMFRGMVECVHELMSHTKVNITATEVNASASDFVLHASW
jgi:uncharacterized protein (TIGR02265 family)